MLFRVSGTNRDTNAPMVLDIEAVSRGAAEIKAQARGMAVTGIDDITVEAADRPTSSHRGEGPAEGTTPDSGGMRNIIVAAILLVLLALTGYFALPMLLQKNVVTPATTTQPAD
ncbi:MAG: hypothetical protein M3478_11660 [Planctomycetota bacterium]|nr:hypothetical protein [Planctomycetota bacterium]